MPTEVLEIFSGTVQVLLAGLLLGAGLPLLFAVGIRLQGIGDGITAEDGTTSGATSPIARAARAGALVIYAVVALAVVIGLLFITRDSLAHYLGIHLPF